MDTVFNLEKEEEFLIMLKEVVENLYITSANDAECAAKEELKHLISSNNYQINNVIDMLKGREFNSDRMQKFVQLINQHKNYILYSALIEYNTTFGTCIRNFNWNVKYILGTNSLKSARYPLLQMQIDTFQIGDKTKSTVYELNKDVLCRLITSLENVIK